MLNGCGSLLFPSDSLYSALIMQLVHKKQMYNQRCLRLWFLNLLSSFASNRTLLRPHHKSPASIIQIKIVALPKITKVRKMWCPSICSPMRLWWSRSESHRCLKSYINCIIDSVIFIVTHCFANVKLFFTISHHNSSLNFHDTLR